MQLLPVKEAPGKSLAHGLSEDGAKSDICREGAAAYANINRHYVFTQAMRQSDKTFARELDALRNGSVTEESRKFWESRWLHGPDFKHKDGQAHTQDRGDFSLDNHECVYITPANGGMNGVIQTNSEYIATQTNVHAVRTHARGHLHQDPTSQAAKQKHRELGKIGTIPMTGQ